MEKNYNENLPLVVYKETHETDKVIFEIKYNGDIILRNKVIANDKEVADVLIRSLRIA